MLLRYESNMYSYYVVSFYDNYDCSDNYFLNMKFEL
jgi:hypothetical protein